MAGNLKDLLISVTAGIGKAQSGLKTVVKDLKDVGKNASTTSSKFNRAMTSMNTSVGKLNDKVQKYSGTMKIAGGVIVGAVGLMIRSSVAYGVQIDKMVKQTGISSKSLSKMAYAAEQEHASIEMLSKALLNLSRVMYDAGITATNEYAIAFEKMGIEIKDVETGALRPIEDVFADVAEAMRIATNDTERAAISQKLFGRSGKELIPMLRLGRDAIRDLYEEAEEFGIVLDDKARKAAKRFDDSMTSLKASLKGVGLAVTSDLLPSLQNATDTMTRCVVVARKFNAEMSGAPARILGVGAAFVAAGLIALPWTLKLIAKSLAIIGSSATLAGIVAIGAAFGVAYIASEDFRRSISEAIDFWTSGSLKANVVAVLKEIGLGFKGVAMMVNELVGWVYNRIAQQGQNFIDWWDKNIEQRVSRLYDRGPQLVPTEAQAGAERDLSARLLSGEKPPDVAPGEDLGKQENAVESLSARMHKVARTISDDLDAIAAKRLAGLKANEEAANKTGEQESAKQAALAGTAAAAEASTTRQIAALQMRLRIADLLKSTQFLFYDEQIQAQTMLTQLLEDWLVASEKERAAIEEKIRLIQLSLDLQRRQREETGIAGEGRFRARDAETGDIVEDMPEGGVQGFQAAAPEFEPGAFGEEEDAEIGQQMIDGIRGLASTFTSGLTNVVMTVGKTSEAMKKALIGLGMQMLTTIVGILIQILVQEILQNVLHPAPLLATGGLTKGKGLAFLHKNEIVTPMNTVQKLMATILPSKANVAGPQLAVAGGSGRTMNVGEMTVQLDNVANVRELMSDLSDYADAEIGRGVS